MKVDHLIADGEKEWIKEIDWKTESSHLLSRRNEMLSACFLRALFFLQNMFRKIPASFKVDGYYHICVRSHYYGVMENSVKSEGCQGVDLDINIGAKRRGDPISSQSMDGQAFRKKLRHGKIQVNYNSRAGEHNVEKRARF